MRSALMLFHGDPIASGTCSHIPARMILRDKDMVDVMRQIPEKKRNPIQKSPVKEKEKEKETRASSFATKEKGSEEKKDGDIASNTLEEFRF